MNLISLRDYIDSHFRQVNKRLDRIEDKLDGHAHTEHPTWPQIIGVLSVLTATIGGALLILA